MTTTRAIYVLCIIGRLEAWTVVIVLNLLHLSIDDPQRRAVVRNLDISPTPERNLVIAVRMYPMMDSQHLQYLA